MRSKGYISEFMNGGRIVSHGKIESLAQGFKLPKDALFTVYARPKTQTADIDAVLSVKCYQDDSFSDAPVPLYDWSPLAIREIAPNDEILSVCDLYWGSGEVLEEEL